MRHGRSRHWWLRTSAVVAAILAVAIGTAVLAIGPHRGILATADGLPSAGPAGRDQQAASPGTARPTRAGSPSPAGTSARPPGGTPTPSQSTTPAQPTAAALVPRSGAYLGAYVQPPAYTPAAEIAAVQQFQRLVRRSVRLIHVYHPWLSPFPDQADRYFVNHGKVLLLTWGGTPDTRAIIAGRYDRLIRARAEALKRLRRPLLLEFRHEMDRPNLQWAIHGPRDYIAAWDHIRSIFRQVGASNVGWVWCPTGYGFQVGRAQAFYPGNNEVDWVCADIYSFAPTQPLAQAAQPFLTWAAHTHKPVIIGEFAVNGAPSSWAGWLTAAGRLAERNPQIKALAYFDANGKDSQGRPFKYWLPTSPRAVSAFAAMLGWRFFRPAIPVVP
ncbi:MAG: glycoside hydrolase family 26 protein [Streptosporangiaceae bacterium]